MAKRDPAIEVGVRLLLVRQLDVAPDRATPGLARAAVGRFHDARPAARHDREPRSRKQRRHAAGRLVIWMVGAEARRAEDRDTWANEVERAEAADELEEDAHRAQELEAAALRTVQEPHGLGGARHLAPLTRAVHPPLTHSAHPG